MMLPSFELHRPRSLDEAIAKAAELTARGEAYDFLSGGTDLLANYKCRINVRPHVISLRHVPEMLGLSETRVGAGELLWRVAESPEIRRVAPALAATAQDVASPLIRESATVGGNLLQDTRCYHFNQTYWWRVAHDSCLKAEADVCRVIPGEKFCVATYCGDLAPVLLVLDATVVLAGPRGRRDVPAREFWVDDGIRRFVKEPDEILVEVRWPAAVRGLRASYRKLRLRQSIDFPDAGVAVALRTEDRLIVECAVATTAIGSAPLLHPEVASIARGRSPGPELARELSAELHAQSKPYRNTFFSPRYRREMLGVLLERALEDALGTPEATASAH